MYHLAKEVFFIAYIRLIGSRAVFAKETYLERKGHELANRGNIVIDALKVFIL